MSATVIGDDASSCIYRSLAIRLLMATRTSASAGRDASIQLRNYVYIYPCRHNNISRPATLLQHNVGSPNDVDCNLCTLKYQLLPIERLLLFENPTFWLLCTRHVYTCVYTWGKRRPCSLPHTKPPHRSLKGYSDARCFCCWCFIANIILMDFFKIYELHTVCYTFHTMMICCR